ISPRLYALRRWPALLRGQSLRPARSPTRAGDPRTARLAPTRARCGVSGGLEGHAASGAGVADDDSQAASRVRVKRSLIQNKMARSTWIGPHFECYDSIKS